jgi:hypothetical protein
MVPTNLQAVTKADMLRAVLEWSCQCFVGVIAGSCSCMCLLVGLDQSSRAMRLSWSSIVVTSLREVGIPVQHHSRGRPASSNDISFH